MKKIFRCPRCGRRLFDVADGEPATELHIQCPRCKTITVFNYSGPVSPTSAPTERHPEPTSSIVSKGEQSWVNLQAKGSREAASDWVCNNAR